jgi:chitodextrinase
VTGYRVYRNGTMFAVLGNVLTVTDSGLAAGTTYLYTVAAVDAAGNLSAPSTAARGTTVAGPDTTAPSVPTGLVATAVSSSQVNLTWNVSTDNVGVTGYIVYLNDVQLATTTTPSFSHTGLTPGVTYNYRVSAFDAVPNHSAWTTAVAATTPVSTPTDTTAPSVPTNLRATSIQANQITLAWNPSKDDVGVAGYVVYVNDAELARTVETTFTHTGLNPNTTYKYRVSAYDAVPNNSAWTAAKSVKTKH